MEWHPTSPDVDQHDRDEDNILSISTPYNKSATNQDQFLKPNPTRTKKWSTIETLPNIELTPPPISNMNG